MIKNLIFDLGGVIMRLNDISVPASRFEAIGMKDVASYMSAYGQQGLFLECENGSIDKEEFVRKLAEASGRESVSMEEAAHAWMGFVKDVPQNRLDNVMRLREKYRVYLLSNTNAFIMDWADSPAFSPSGHPIGHYFDEVYISYRMHDYKPARSIFEKMLSSAGLKAEESIFIDDSLKNVEAARSVGLHSILVPREEDWIDILTDYLNQNQA